MEATAVILEAPERIAVGRLVLDSPGESDIVVDVRWSGISTGTERLLWSGRMPDFPGMGYPLVPGYESVGTVVEAGPGSVRKQGELVFVPGARCFGKVRGLFGGAASRLVVGSDRVARLDPSLGEDGILLALAATGYHALAGAPPPDLIVGHGVLGRLIARLAVALGGEPVVWETNPARAEGATGYRVVHPESDTNRGYRQICDVSGDAGILDTLILHCARGAEIVLAGFYAERLSFSFPPAFMREVRLRVAAEWRESDLAATTALIDDGRLSFADLITHRRHAADAEDAYRVAFGDSACLKMVLDWRNMQ
jgi:3-hydroxyethyl bacteriochlorophyllide a dehydrogenase